MAESLILKSGEIPKADSSYLASESHTESALLALKFLKRFKDIEIRRIQFPKGQAYTCWYVSLVGHQNLKVANFTLCPNSSLNVEFRFMELVRPERRDVLSWQTQNWPMARLSKTQFSFDEVFTMLKEYIPKAVRACKDGKLKRGGTSAAETVIADILEVIYPNKFIQNIRPEWLRNEAGNLLELDFNICNKIAIEVQGPHHYRDMYNKPEQLKKTKCNDRFKITRCADKGISLIWMNSQGIQKELTRYSFPKQQDHIKHLLNQALENSPCHITWESPNEDLKFTHASDL